MNFITTKGGMSLKQSGFTLLEILIAMSIAALIGIAAMSLLDKATIVHKNIKDKGTRYNNIERTMLFISNDIQQLAPRKFRDEFGDLKDNLSSDDSVGTTRLSLTRLGRRNPAGLARSNLEKLTYLVEDEKLMRISFLHPDGMSQNSALARTLLEDVESLTVSFYDGENWTDFWPVDGAGFSQDESRKNPLPVAARVTLVLKDLGKINRLFVISDSKKQVNDNA